MRTEGFTVYLRQKERCGVESNTRQKAVKDWEHIQDKGKSTFFFFVKSKYILYKYKWNFIYTNCHISIFVVVDIYMQVCGPGT